MGLCKERDAKRRQFEEKATDKKVLTPAQPVVKAKPKLQVQKPLSYEELMKKAEMNSKNILSVSDLKQKIDPLRKPELKRSIPPLRTDSKPIPKTFNNTNKSSLTFKKQPVKVIKRNMQPRTETSDLVILNQKKRDLRSIEEIQIEIKQQNKQKKYETKIKEPKEPEENDEVYYAKNYSSIISNLFGYNRNKYAGMADDDDDLLDMEADYRTVMAEEARSTRFGKDEDLKEELKEIERKKQKLALLNKTGK